MDLDDWKDLVLYDKRLTYWTQCICKLCKIGWLDNEQHFKHSANENCYHTICWLYINRWILGIK